MALYRYLYMCYDKNVYFGEGVTVFYFRRGWDSSICIYPTSLIPFSFYLFTTPARRMAWVTPITPSSPLIPLFHLSSTCIFDIVSIRLSIGYAVTMAGAKSALPYIFSFL